MLKLRSLPNGAGTVASLLLRVAAPAVEWQPPGTGARCQAGLRREFGLLRCSRNQMEAAPKLGRNRQLSILPLLVDHPRSRFDNQRPTMKILIASTLCDGPYQSDARDLAYTSRRQPRDRLLTGIAFRDGIEASGAQFLPLPPTLISTGGIFSR